jgi:hypothetical protein
MCDDILICKKVASMIYFLLNKIKAVFTIINNLKRTFNIFIAN